MYSCCPSVHIIRQDYWFINLYLHEHLTQKHVFKLTLLHGRTEFSIMKWEFVLGESRLHWRRQRCWAPAVFLLTSSPLPGWVGGLSVAPWTQFLPHSFPSVGRPPDLLYTLSQPVHVSHVWTWVQVEPWEVRYLPRCTVAKHHGQSKSSSCCSTVEEKRVYLTNLNTLSIRKWITSGCTQ